jgi:DNA polymerase
MPTHRSALAALLRDWVQAAGDDLPAGPSRAAPPASAPRAASPAAAPAAAAAALPAAAPRGSDDVLTQLAGIAAEVIACTRCRLCETRTRAVPGEGNPRPRILFVGEGPGADEDASGRPFVGRAGQLLTQIIEKGMGLRREDVFIANVIKCRPPANRDPMPDEVAACHGYLQRQIAALQPEVIVTLGRISTSMLTGSAASQGTLRGRVHDYHGIKLVPTWHPAYLLRNPAAKKDTWQDVKLVLELLGLPVPGQPARGPQEGRGP